MRRQYIEVPLSYRCRGVRAQWMRLKGNVLGPLYWLAARAAGGPGLAFHLKCSWLGLIAFFTRCIPRGSYSLMFFPMDSTRYFEFHEAWNRLRSRPSSLHLDVSSPRLLPLMLLRAHPQTTVEFINPDPNDIRDTEKFVRAFAPGDRCRFTHCTLEEAPFPAASFDLVTCLSVLEHIPEDRDAVERMWALLRPGGRLVLTVPCTASPMEQYISHNQYGVLAPESDGYTFWQRYYDSQRLEERILAVAGQPVHMAVYGERTNGLFFRNATLKRLLGGGYPFWREPYMMATEYRYFRTVDELPGEGVAYLEFVKP
jgi:SAM-dependent methyltransferase